MACIERWRRRSCARKQVLCPWPAYTAAAVLLFALVVVVVGGVEVVVVAVALDVVVRVVQDRDDAR